MTSGVELLRYGPHTVARLYDKGTGAEALVHCTYGFNLFSWRVPLAGRAYEVLKAEDHFSEHPRGAGGNGTPILFPFPNRIAGGRFEWEGKVYELERNERGVNAIHGFVLNRPWSVSLHEGPKIEGAFRLSRHAPALLDRWPSDFELKCSIALGASTVQFHFNVTNVGSQRLPWGLGIHPYFRLPLAMPGSEERCRVRVPADAIWELKEFIPTGRILDVPPELDLRKARPLSELKLDHVYTRLQFDGDWCVCELQDEDVPARVRVKFDRTFREVVVYTPPSRGSICIEPYTCTTNAINLHAQGIDAGLRILEPGESADAGTIIFEVGP